MFTTPNELQDAIDTLPELEYDGAYIVVHTCSAVLKLTTTGIYVGEFLLAPMHGSQPIYVDKAYVVVPISVASEYDECDMETWEYYEEYHVPIQPYGGLSFEYTYRWEDSVKDYIESHEPVDHGKWCVT